MIKLLVIGDSISIDYQKYLQIYVDDKIEIYSKNGIKEAYRDLDIIAGANCGDSSTTLEYLKMLDDNGILNYDYCIFNCGLHDIKRDTQKGYPLQIGEGLYKVNLCKIVEVLKKNNITPVFVSTTASYEERYKNASFIRRIDDVIRYNEIGREVMEQKGIEIIDLYRFTLGLGLSGDSLFRDHTHFTDEVIKLQAAYIAGAVNMFVSKHL